MIFEIFVLAAITAALAFGREKRRSISDGVWVGALGGLLWLVFIILIASPALKASWIALPRYISSVLIGDVLRLNAVIGVLLLLVFTAVIGAMYAFLLRTFESQRVILSGIFYGLTIWGLLHLFMVKDNFPPIWLAVSFAIYGLFIGTVFSYLPGWLLTTGKEKKVPRLKTRKTKKRKRIRR